MKETFITLTNTETGESYSGTVTQVALGHKLNPATVAQWNRKNKPPKPYEITPFIQPVDNQGFKSNDNETQKQQNLQGTDNQEVKSNTDHSARIKNLVKQGILTQEEADLIIQSKPTEQYTKTILPQKPCIICGEPVFHTKTLNGKLQHICFDQHIKIPHHKDRIPPNPEIIKMLNERFANVLSPQT